MAEAGAAANPWNRREDELLRKARAALAGAASELDHGRYEHVANRCYYACCQAVVAALTAEGIRLAAGSDGRWSHSAVQAQFNELLINRRKRYGANLRPTLGDLATLRQKADYSRRPVTKSEAQSALRQAERFVHAVPRRSAT